MTKKIAKKKVAVKSKPQPMILKLFPSTGVLGAMVDIAMVAVLMSGALVMAVSAIMMAGKITIIAGK
jgi:putative flippase GtrA